MKPTKYFAILLIFFLTASAVKAQNESSDTQLAMAYFNDKKFEQAADIFLKLYDRTSSKFYFDYYIKSLTELKEYVTAEKELKKAIHANKSDLSYLVDLGYLFQLQNDYETAKKYYDDVIERLPPDRNIISHVANAFIVKQEYDYAEKTYIQAQRKIIGPKYHYELANIYAAKRDYQKMIDEYLEQLYEAPSALENVKARLQYYVVASRDVDFNSLLEVSLIKRVQKFMNLPVYNDLLLWFYIQQKNYTAALIQAKALDKRLSENSARVISIAGLALSNGEYDIAIDAYNYSISNSERANYQKARLGLLDAYYQKVTNGLIKDDQQIAQLEKEYVNAINEFGMSSITIHIIRDLAHIEAFYLNKPKDAEELLNKALALSGLPYDLVAICKIELADIQLLTGDIWEAVLTYGQVEKANSENPYGHDAKFRKAKIAYYTGQFEWAKAQLDVLKASTSKLIANDATELSLLISDNLNEDSVSTPLKMFARADLALVQNKDSLAFLTFDSILRIYPQHNVVDDVYYRKAEVYTRQNKLNEAIAEYNKIVEQFGWGILADNALYNLGLLYERLGNKEKAMEAYKELMINHGDSIFVQEARQRFRTLRGDVNTVL
jgi:tetratricopeptide (TPR) repeat protein